MHELSIALEIHRVSRAAVGDAPGRLEAVRVAVGELSAVDPELLRYAWEAVDAEARLDVEWRPARQFCESCGEDKPRAEGSWLRLCPDCDLPLKVEGGDELDVLQVTWRSENV